MEIRKSLNALLEQGDTHLAELEKAKALLARISVRALRDVQHEIERITGEQVVWQNGYNEWIAPELDGLSEQEFRVLTDCWAAADEYDRISVRCGKPLPLG